MEPHKIECLGFVATARERGTTEYDVSFPWKEGSDGYMQQAIFSGTDTELLELATRLIAVAIRLPKRDGTKVPVVDMDKWRQESKTSNDGQPMPRRRRSMESKIKAIQKSSDEGFWGKKPKKDELPSLYKKGVDALKKKLPKLNK